MITVKDLTEELNYQMQFSELKTRDELDQLIVHYSHMFLKYCNEVPEFTLDNRGRIYLNEISI